MNTDEILKALAAALAGEGPAVRFSPDVTELVAAPEGIAVVVGTSGSTGQPKQTMLSVEALAASSMGTAMALRGEGQWLLALPTHYVAGVQVLVRSLFAGTRPEVMRGAFSPEAIITAAQEMTDPFRITSLVPTQLQRLLDAPEALPALRRFNAVLLGGAPASERLLAQARELELNVVTTYGSAETCGGCVYDGEPLDGVEVAVREGPHGHNTVWLGGATIADGYLGDPERSAEAFETIEGTRWYRTGDLGSFDDDGALRILGRADDVLISGGLKISAHSVAQALQAIDGVRDVFVAGIADRDWGQKVVAAVVLEKDLDVLSLKDQAASVLASHEVPKSFLVVEQLPLLPQGKVDRLSLLSQLEAENQRE